MSAPSEKAPKKVKEKRQTPEARAEAMRYNHMMYGPTANEQRRVQKKLNLGAPYLAHPKFLALMEAFRKGASYQFEVTDKGRTFPVTTDGTQITFDGKTIYYSRQSNRYEDHLLMDRAVMLQYQTTEALIHLAGAVLKAMPELEAQPLTTLNQQLYYGIQSLEAGVEESGPNLLVGEFRHARSTERARK